MGLDTFVNKLPVMKRDIQASILTFLNTSCFVINSVYSHMPFLWVGVEAVITCHANEHTLRFLTEADENMHSIHYILRTTAGLQSIS